MRQSICEREPNVRRQFCTNSRALQPAGLEMSKHTTGREENMGTKKKRLTIKHVHPYGTALQYNTGQTIHFNLTAI